MPAAKLPGRDCALCPRLVAFRETQRKAHPDWFNAPVPSFGVAAAELLIVGLAPGLRGANRTGRPFTGDYAGDLLYATLRKFGLALGHYDARADDGLALVGARITNAVRCVPPQNKPEPREITACRRFLVQEMMASPGLRAFVALGAIAHDAVLVGAWACAVHCSGSAMVRCMRSPMGGCWPTAITARGSTPTPES